MKQREPIIVLTIGFLFVLVSREEVRNMKINDVNRIGSLNPYRNNMPDNLSSVGSKGKKKDEVQISDEAKRLLESQSAVDPSRIKQIADLKDAVSTGTYIVESGKVADSLWPYLNG